MSARAAPAQPETFYFNRNHWVPNNARLPLLLYHDVTDEAEDDPARAFERMFARNGWPPCWHGGIFDYHHYHSTAHEVLGVASGKAQLILGGPEKPPIAMKKGDVLVLPAGTGHCALACTDDFRVVGAYPPGQDFDICREAPDAVMLRRIETLDYPHSDPVAGAYGPLVRLWS